MLTSKSWNGAHCSIPALKFLYCLTKVLILISTEELEHFLARIVQRIWKVVLLVRPTSYTTSFASMITASKFHPSVPGVHELQKNGQYVGFHQGFYEKGLLLEIGFALLIHKKSGPMLHLPISIVLFLMEALLWLYMMFHTSNFFSRSTTKVTVVSLSPIYRSAYFAFVSLSTLTILLKSLLPKHANVKLMCSSWF